MKRRLGVLLLLALLGAGCQAPLSTVPPSAPPPAPTDTPLPVWASGEWQTVRPGLDYRELEVKVDQRGDLLRLARVDPSQLRLRVVYAPSQPRRVSGWLAAEGVLLAVNGGYFDPQHQALGLLICAGKRYGQPYAGFGGMFAVGDTGVRVRWNMAEPYQPGEALTDALQNFPMLVLPGGAPNQAIDDNGQFAPRTVVGQDRQGRIVFMVSQGSIFTLTGLGQWLAASDLDLDAALNLDGGSSSGLLMQAVGQTLGLDSWVEVPDAIVVDALGQ